MLSNSCPHWGWSFCVLWNPRFQIQGWSICQVSGVYARKLEYYKLNMQLFVALVEDCNLSPFPGLLLISQTCRTLKQCLIFTISGVNWDITLHQLIVSPQERPAPIFQICPRDLPRPVLALPLPQIHRRTGVWPEAAEELHPEH